MSAAGGARRPPTHAHRRAPLRVHGLRQDVHRRRAPARARQDTHRPEVSASTTTQLCKFTFSHVNTLRLGNLEISVKTYIFGQIGTYTHTLAIIFITLLWFSRFMRGDVEWETWNKR